MTPELEPRDREVLSVLVAHGGETTTSSLRDHIEWMIQPSQSSYRVDKLSDLGLVSATSGVSDGSYVTRRVQLTDSGREYVDNHDIETGDPDLSHRLDRLEAKNKSIQKQVAAQQAVIDEVERIFDDLGINMEVEQIMRESVEIENS
jgi:DNA-binding MarR family transcriptional regulator